MTPTAGDRGAVQVRPLVTQAPTSRPPLEPPVIASLGSGVVLRDEPLGRRDEVFEHHLLVRAVACRCHFSPYSPPPRMLAMAYTPPISSHAMCAGLKVGSMEIPNPP